MIFLNFFKAILSHKKIMFGWLIAGLIIAIIVTIFQPPVYIASSKWYIQKVASGSILSGLTKSSGENVLGKIAGSLFKKKSNNTTAIDAAILTSTSIVKDIIVKADLKDRDGNYISVEDFRKNLIIKPDRKFPFLTIKYCSKDPEEAYKVLMIAEEVFTDKNINAEARKAQENSRFLKEEVEKSKKLADTAAKNLKKFEKQSKVIDIQAEAADQQSRIKELENNLTEYKTTLAAIKSKINDLKSKLNINSTVQAMDKSTIGDDIDITSLKSRLVDKNTQLIALTSKYTDQHFKVKEVKEEISKIQKEIESRQKILIGKSIPSDKVAGIKQLQFSMIDNLVDLSTQEVALSSRIEALQKTIDDYSTDFSKLPDKKLHFKNLEFENEFQKKLLKNLDLNYENLKIKEKFAKNTINIMKIREPVIPSKPTFPNVYLNIAIGLTIAFILAYLNVLIVETMDDKIRVSEQLHNLCCHTFLGTLTCQNIIASKGFQPVFRCDNNDVISEFRKQRINLSFLKQDSKVNDIAFIYPEALNYPSITLIDLAIFLAESGKRVLIVDANFRDSLIPSLLSLERITIGLSNYLSGDNKNYNELIIPLLVADNLYLFPNGNQPPNPTDILDSIKMKELAESLCKSYDFVLYNLPAFNPFADALIVSRFIKGNILLAISSITTFKDFSHLQNLFKANQASVIGSMLLKLRKIY